jgi:hypothetical protein
MDPRDATLEDFAAVWQHPELGWERLAINGRTINDGRFFRVVEGEMVASSRPSIMGIVVYLTALSQRRKIVICTVMNEVPMEFLPRSQDTDLYRHFLAELDKRHKAEAERFAQDVAKARKSKAAK